MKTRFLLLRIVQAFVLIAALALGATPVLATVSCPSGGGQLEIDNPSANVTVQNTGTCDDWQSIFGGGTSGLTFTCNVEGDNLLPLGKAPGSTSTANAASCVSARTVHGFIFTGGSSKDEHDITDWTGKDSGGLPDKDSLITGFAARYPSNILYFGGDRFSVGGDAQIGFWFFQNPVSFDPATGAFSGTHKNGDLLILSNFTNGGTQTNIAAFKVNNCPTTGPCSTFTLDPLPAGAAVTGAKGQSHVCDSLDHICAATDCPVVTTANNGTTSCSGTTPSLDPAFQDKSGTAQGNYGAVAFFEGGLDLGANGLGAECFASFLLETRASQKIDSVLKDFIIGQFEECKAKVKTEVHNASHQVVTQVTATTQVHDKAFVTGEINFSTPTGTVTFSFFDCGTISPCTVNTTDGSCLGGTSVLQLACELAVPLTEVQAPSTTQPGIAAADMLQNNSTCFRTPGVGFHAYRAHYNPSATSLYPAADSSCEPFQVVSVSSHITTRVVLAGTNTEVTNTLLDLDGNVPLSVQVQDQATVTCEGGITPTGRVTFTRYSDGACTGTVTTDNCGNNTPPNVGCPVDGSGKALSTAFALGPNALSYTAVYNGDAACNRSFNNSLCEPVCAIKVLRHCSVTTDRGCSVSTDCPQGETCVVQNFP